MAMLENPLFEFPRGFFSFQGTHPPNQNPLKLKNLEYIYFLHKPSEVTTIPNFMNQYFSLLR